MFLLMNEIIIVKKMTENMFLLMNENIIFKKKLTENRPK